MAIVNTTLGSDALDHARVEVDDDDKQLYRDVQVYYLDVIPDVAANDCVAVVAIMDHVYQRLRHFFPTARYTALFSDNAGAYTSAAVLLALPFISYAHNFVVTDFLHGEAGDGKNEGDGHFGVLGHLVNVRCRAFYCPACSRTSCRVLTTEILVDEAVTPCTPVPRCVLFEQRGVASGHNVTTLRELFDVLTAHPVRNTTTTVLECNGDVMDRLKQLHDAIKLVGISAARHVTYGKVDLTGTLPVRITLWRQSSYCPPLVISDQVIRAVYDVLRQHPFDLGLAESNTTMRTKIVHSNEDSVFVERSKHWGRGAGSVEAKRQQRLGAQLPGVQPPVPPPGGKPDVPAFRAVTVPGASAVLCGTCGAVYYRGQSYAGHTCPPGPGALAAATEAVRAAIAKDLAEPGSVSHHFAPDAVHVMPLDQAGVSPLRPGFCSHPPRQEHKVPEAIKEFLKDLYHLGDMKTKAGRTHKKQSAATAREAVRVAIDSGELDADADELPEEAAIQSLFNTLSSRKNTLNRTAYLQHQSLPFVR